MRQLLWLSAGAALNVAILLLPALIMGRLAHSMVDRSWLLFLAMATIFCLGDLTTINQPASAAILADGRVERYARRLSLATGLVILAIFWTASVQHLVHPWSVPTVALPIGMILMLLGTGLRFAAICTLGRHFVSEVTIRPGQPLVEFGPYHYIRHPSETGILAVAFGACLILNSSLALLISSGVLLPLVLWRLRREERCLLGSFGERYHAYAKRVKRLIPFVY